MTPLSGYSPVTRGGRGRAAAVALGAGTLVVTAGCSASPAGSPKPLTAHAAISLAADQTQRVNSAAAAFSTSLAGALSETTAGTIQIQIRPSLLIDAHVTVSSSGQSFPLDEIMSAKAIYLGSSTLSALAGRSGKPWIEISFSDLSGNLGNTLQNLLQTAQNSDPVTQTKLLTASKNAHVAGTQVIDGIRTTHYAGTFAPSAGLSALSPSPRKELAPFLSLITGDIHFDAWIDARRVTRKLVEVETVNGETVTQTIRVLAVNQPVHITLPPASQVIIPPKGKLGS